MIDRKELDRFDPRGFSPDTVAGSLFFTGREAGFFDRAVGEVATASGKFVVAKLVTVETAADKKLVEQWLDIVAARQAARDIDDGWLPTQHREADYVDIQRNEYRHNADSMLGRGKNEVYRYLTDPTRQSLDAVMERYTAIEAQDIQAGMFRPRSADSAPLGTATLQPGSGLL